MSSSDKDISIQRSRDLGVIEQDDAHGLNPQPAPVNSTPEKELNSGSNTEYSKGDPASSQAQVTLELDSASAFSSTSGNDMRIDQRDDQGDEDEEDEEESDTDSDPDFPRFEDIPRGRIVKPVSGQKPPSKPKKSS